MTLRFAALTSGALLLTTACGGDGNGVYHWTIAIASVQSADGDVAFDPVSRSYTVASALSTQNVRYGVDSSVASAPEYRAFLDFPLDGSGGGALLPGGVQVLEATLEVFVQATNFAANITTLLEVVPFPRTGPRDVDFSTGSISSRPLNLFASDTGLFVDINVDAQLTEALAQGLADFQVRLALDPSQGSQGLVQIADASPDLAPALHVRYLR